MGWDGMGREILENRPIPWDEKFFDPIPWDGIPFKNLSSHPMGRFLLSHGIPRRALVPMIFSRLLIVATK